MTLSETQSVTTTDMSVVTDRQQQMMGREGERREREQQMMEREKDRQTTAHDEERERSETDR